MHSPARAPVVNAAGALACGGSSCCVRLPNDVHHLSGIQDSNIE
jgi:hypothetical protein